MIIYWSSDPQESASDVRTQAKSLTIDAVWHISDPVKLGVFGRTASGRGFDNIVGEYLAGTLIVSADQMNLPRNIEGDIKTIREFLLLWEDATFRWIEDLKQGIEDPMRVTLAEVPQRRRLNNRADQVEYEYKLTEKEFRFNE